MTETDSIYETLCILLCISRTLDNRQSPTFNSLP